MARGDITRAAVLEVLAEAKQLGRDEFNRVHHFERARTYELIHDGDVFDSKAIYTVAYDRLHPETAPIRESGTYTGGLGRVVPELEALGFEITRSRSTDRVAGNAGRAWLVRAGEAGAQEPYAIDESRVVIGWDQFGDLDAYRDVDRLTALVRDEYEENDRPVGTATKHAGETFAFVSEIEIGDVVVLPRDAGVVAIGEVLTDYEYDASAPLGCRHQRRVSWLALDVPRSRFPEELQSAIGYRGTVREFPGLQAAQRIRHLAEGPVSSLASSWIFQANRKRWDLLGALAELTTIDYDVNQYPKEVQAGDAVFLWLAGADGGVYATARVLTDPSDIPLRLRELDRFWITDAPTDDGKPRVWLRVTRVLDKPLLRDDLKNRPETADLPIIGFPNATNFPLTDEQAEELSRLVAEADGRDVEREKLFLFTASSVHAAEHLETSLVEGIALDDLRELTEIQPALEHHAIDGRVFAWCARAGSAAEKKWERLNPGDIGLVYRGGQFVLWGRVYPRPSRSWSPSESGAMTVLRPGIACTSWTRS
jgi:hypothetical protein